MGSKNVLSNAVILESQVMTLLSIYETLMNVSYIQSHLLKLHVLWNYAERKLTFSKTKEIRINYFRFCFSQKYVWSC